jgi:diadenosine tetraphosphate (Ap4A) HIT family hydrolase
MAPPTPWMTREEWAWLKRGEDCGFCADMHLEANESSFLVAELEWSYVRFARNQYRRGWTLLALKRHACELFELTDRESAGFWREVAAVARALDQVYQPAKMNYAVGNLNPHIHCHLVLQCFTDDPTLPLNMHAEDVRLEEQDYQQLVRALRQALGPATKTVSKSNE